MTDLTDIPMLVPGSRDPERILAYASEGSGKSFNALMWAVRIIANGRHVWIVDSDQAMGRMLEDPLFAHLPIAEWWFNGRRVPEYETTTQDEEPGLHVFQTAGWEQHKKALGIFKDKRELGDLLIIDSGTDMWTDPQSWYTEEVFGQDMGDYFLKTRKALEDSAKKLDTFDGWTDWQVINAQYFTNVQEILKKPGCHLYVTAEADKVVTSGKNADDKKVQGMYGEVGAKPKGQKSIGFKVMTVMHLSTDRSGSHYMTTVKDRSRRLLDEEEYTDFVKDYLIGVAGWHEKGTGSPSATGSSGQTRRRKKITTN